MRYKDDMLFAHPVLREGSDDFLSAAFGVEFFHEIKETIFSLTSKIELNCSDLRDLIENGEAGVGYFIACRDTLQNRLVEVGLEVTVQDFPLVNFYGTVSLRPVVWAKAEKEGWSSSGINEEYEDDARFDRFALLAVADEVSFTVEQEFLKPLESIFELAPDASGRIEKNNFQVDIGGDKIRIVTHPDTKILVDRIRFKPSGRVVLFNSLYLPVVMEVVGQIKEGDSGFESQPWYRVFSAKCAEAGMASLDNVSAFDAAQRLLESPFQQLDDNKEQLF